MLELIDYDNIRRLDQDGWSIRRIAKYLKHSRDTVRKALEWDGSVPRYRLSKPRPCSKATPEVVEAVEGILKSDLEAPRKQRHTALQIHDELAAKFPGHEPAESTVRKLVKEIRAGMRRLPDVTLPLYFAPGEEAQVDWGESTVVLNGVEQVANTLIVTLCFSRRSFAMAFPSQKQEVFLEAHVRAFEHFGGRTARLAYDNLTTAVKSILQGGAREENETFKAFRGFYGFEARFCTPGKEGAHEKGRVERRVALLRSDVFVPVPEVDSWAELNARLLAKCESRDALRHPEFRDQTILEVFQREREALRALPARRFACCRCELVRVDGQAQVHFEKAIYSLPVEYGRRQVDLLAYFDRVEIWCDLKLIGTWPRSYSGGEHYDYKHYLPLLKKAPCGCLNGKPYLTMPAPLQKYRATLLAQLERRAAGKALAKVLLLILEHSETSVLEAVELSLLYGTVDPDAVKNFLLQLLSQSRPKPLPVDLSERPALQSFTVPPASLDPYDQLIGACS